MDWDGIYWCRAVGQNGYSRRTKGTWNILGVCNRIDGIKNGLVLGAASALCTYCVCIRIREGMGDGGHPLEFVVSSRSLEELGPCSLSEKTSNKYKMRPMLINYTY